MKRSCNCYPAEIKEKVVEEYYQGVKPRELSKKYGISSKTIYPWIHTPKQKSNSRGVIPNAIPEEAINKTEIKNIIAKKLFQRINVGTHLNLSYKHTGGGKSGDSLLEAIRAKDCIVFSKNDKGVIFVQEIGQAHKREGISFNEIVCGAVKVQLVSV